MERLPQHLAGAAAGDHGVPEVDERTVDLPTGVLTVSARPGPYALDALVGFAARANAKRGFLFVSKVLGKHWPVRPAVMRALHASLAAGLPADLPGPVVFIAMAETAVGLGQGVFEAWLERDTGRQAVFLHTTRYRVGTGPLIEFEEAHSHAPRQFLHLPDDAVLADRFARARSIVLIDDEASTGNTFVNLAAACRAVAPAIAHVHLVTITNFMGEDGNRRLPDRFGVRLTHSAALEGAYAFAPGALQPGAAPAQRYDATADRGASGRFGRLGVDHALALPAALVAGLFAGPAGGADRVPSAPVQPGQRVLVLGTGEFMHPAFLLGRALEAQGVDVMVQSTTRSPILVGGAVRCAATFADNYGEGVANFLYNVAPGQYDHILVCHETPPHAALYALAGKLGARLFHFTSETLVEEIPVR
ncbi:MAG: phosphoribosyltransferase domain-containing protein [Duganella sp.]